MINMNTQNILFSNHQGEQLAARLELPMDTHPKAFALFAHCFTCNKNLSAVKNISRALARQGFGVMRFDFTGLGESEGDFADTNFSSNIQDLISATKYLEENYQAPSLLVGHSLGGAAVIRAAYQLKSVKAVATIGAPFDPDHVTHLLSDSYEKINATGLATVNIGGRPFTIKKQFLEDIGNHKQNNQIAQIGKALLMLHSPQDRIVSIDHAAHIYQSARHPKSFVSLDGADHLLTNKNDSRYVGQVIASWSQRYIDWPQKENLNVGKDVTIRLQSKDQFTTDIQVRHHALISDEPAKAGGNDYGPNPYEYLSASIGACTAMTLHMYARRKKWPLDSVKINVEHFKDYPRDQQACYDGNPAKIDHFHKEIRITGELSDEQHSRLLEIADRCPVHRTLQSPVEIKSTVYQK